MTLQKEQLIEKMNDLLKEASDLNGEDINDSNYRQYYQEAVDMLNLYEENEDGEMDIYQFTYDYLREYESLRSELEKIISKERE